MSISSANNPLQKRTVMALTSQLNAAFANHKKQTMIKKGDGSDLESDDDSSSSSSSDSSDSD